MARLSQKDAQGHGDLRSYFGVPKVVSHAVKAVKDLVSPKKDRTRGMFACLLTLLERTKGMDTYKNTFQILRTALRRLPHPYLVTTTREPKTQTCDIKLA